MKLDFKEYYIEENILAIYKAKDYPLALERICKAIDNGGGQTVNISGVLEALNEAGYIIKLK